MTAPTAGSNADAPGDTGRRLREILAILGKHRVAGGLSPEKLRAVLEDLSPTFVKLGQILSMRRDMLSQAYCLELSKLRAEVSPMSIQDVRAVVEGEYSRPLEEVFSSFEAAPLGSASIAQVHAARPAGGAGGAGALEDLPREAVTGKAWCLSVKKPPGGRLFHG